MKVSWVSITAENGEQNVASLLSKYSKRSLASYVLPYTNKGMFVRKIIVGK